MTTDTKTTLLPAARLAEIREAFAAHDNGEAECDAQSLADFTRDLLAHLDALTAELAEAHTRAVAPCRVDPFNSRACERGTKGCEARHWEPRARGEGSPT